MILRARLPLSIFLGLLLIAAGMPVHSHSHDRAPGPGDDFARLRGAAAADLSWPAEAARLGGEAKVRAAGRRKSYLPLGEGRELFSSYPRSYASSCEVTAQLEGGGIEPKALSSGDTNRADGKP